VKGIELTGRSVKKFNLPSRLQKQQLKLPDFSIHLKLRGFHQVDKAKIALGFSLSEARIGTVEGGESGVLVWKSGQLVAVLTQIDEDAYSTKGKWFLETGFGLLSGQHRNFDTIDEAVSWVGRYTFPEPARSANPSAVSATAN
jgi:hypothetical protein